MSEIQIPYGCEKFKNIRKYHKRKEFSVFLFANERKRSPLAFQLYDYLSSNSNDRLDVMFFRNMNCVNNTLIKYGKPDCIYIGLGWLSYQIKEDIQIIKKNGIRIISEIADAECCFDSPPQRSNRGRFIRNIPIDLVIAKLSPSWVGTAKLKNYIKNNEFTVNSKLIHSPWAINPDLYSGTKEKDIDVAVICTMGANWLYHQNRIEIAKKINDMKGITSYVGSVYGQEYIDILQRSKMFIVDTSQRGGMSQKYLEGVACGCMLLGEIPTGEKYLFEEGKTIVSANVNNIVEKVKYYLNHDEERKTIADLCRKRIIKSRNVERMGRILERKIIKVCEEAKELV